MTNERPRDDLIIGEHYYILASGIAADLPKLVLKHDEAFLVADRRGDCPQLPGSEFGFYADGTRHLSQLELRVHGVRPLSLNAGTSEDGLEAAIDLTNPDMALAPVRASAAAPTLDAARLRYDEGALQLDYAVRAAWFDHQAAVIAWEASIRSVRRSRRPRRARSGSCSRSRRLRTRSCSGRGSSRSA